MCRVNSIRPQLIFACLRKQPFQFREKSRASRRQSFVVQGSIKQQSSGTAVASMIIGGRDAQRELHERQASFLVVAQLSRNTEVAVHQKMKLRDFAWWPKTWLTEESAISPADQVRRGHLEECDLGPHGLLIVVNDYYGERVFGSVPQRSFDSPGNIVEVLDFLLKHLGESIGSVEDLDVEPERFI